MELKKEDRQKDINGELIVPRRILMMMMMEAKYQSGLTIDELCKIYIDGYCR